MATDVYSAIALYLKDIHTKHVWPTLAGTHSQPAPRGGRRQTATDDSRPDLLVAFNQLMMKTHAKAVRMFEVVVPCTSNDDCRQNEECIKGVCTPVGDGEGSSASAQRCNSTDECRQNEECIDGFCTPVAANLVFADRTTKVPVTAEVGAELEAYWTSIHAVLVRGLAEKPTKIAAVRDLLTATYADAATLAGAGLTGCRTGIECKEDEVCTNGVCVPIPFRLVFRRPDAPRPAPWS